MTMGLDVAHIRLVQASFAEVRPISEQAAAIFYARLFEIAPEVKPLFKGDMVEQGRKLMAMLAVVVNGLDKLDSIVPAAQELACKHVGYGVRKEHYAVVGSALLYALGAGLGSAFTHEVKQAWSDAYAVLAGVMIAAAEQFEAENGVS